MTYYRCLLCVPMLLSLLASGPLAAATYVVRPDGSGDYPTIQGAIDACADDDTVLAAAGTYRGPGNKDLDFRGIDLVLRSEEGPASTKIDCEQLGRGLRLHSGETPASLVEGFTISNGMAGAGDFDGGGGISCIDGSSPTIRNCVIIGNQGNGCGGAVYCFDSGPLLINCFLLGNTASDAGGGIACHNDCNVLVAGCTITGNSVTGSMFGGGGIYSVNSEVLISGSTISGNMSQGGGGGLSTAMNTTTTLERTIIWGNCAQLLGDEIYTGGGDVSLFCCALDQSGVSGSLEYIGEQVFSDPLLCDPESCQDAPTGEGSYSLDVSSPCVPENSPCGELIGSTGADCGFPSAACCVGEVCVVLTEGECLALGGIWFPQQPNCEDFDCPPVGVQETHWGPIKRGFQ